MKIEKTDSFNIDKNNKVTVIESGNIVEVRTMTGDILPHIQKLNADEYIHLATGEVKEINHQTKRLDNTETLKQTFSYLRKLINANVTDKNINLCRFVTLTYKENMTDTKRLKKDLKNYHLRFNYYCRKKAIPPPEYITVIEPQQRGAWHAHIIYIFKQVPPFIPKSELKKIWGRGFVSIKVIDENCDNVGAYLCAYVTDISIDELDDIRLLNNVKTNEPKTIESDSTSKSYIKGLRLYLYPKGIRIFRHSKGVKLPKKYNCTYGEAMEMLQGSTKTYEKSIALINSDTDEIINKIKYEHFNKIRKKET